MVSAHPPRSSRTLSNRHALSGVAALAAVALMAPVTSPGVTAHADIDLLDNLDIISDSSTILDPGATSDFSFGDIGDIFNGIEHGLTSFLNEIFDPFDFSNSDDSWSALVPSEDVAESNLPGSAADFNPIFETFIDWIFGQTASNVKIFFDDNPELVALLNAVTGGIAGALIGLIPK